MLGYGRGLSQSHRGGEVKRPNLNLTPPGAKQNAVTPRVNLESSFPVRLRKGFEGKSERDGTLLSHIQGYASKVHHHFHCQGILLGK